MQTKDGAQVGLVERHWTDDLAADLGARVCPMCHKGPGHARDCSAALADKEQP
jgi:hypothetical protein